MEDEVVDLLRDRTSEDLNQILKSSMGGYTKKSVQDYIAQIRKQQQNTARRFNEDIQNLLSEKEALQKTLDHTRAQLTQREAQYQSLSETMLEYKMHDGELSLDDFKQLRQQVEVLQNELYQREHDAALAKQEQEHLQNKIADLNGVLEQTVQEKRLAYELLHEEKLKVTDALQQVKDLSAKLVLAQNEIAFLQQITSEGALASLKEQVAQLQVKDETQTELMEQKKLQLQAREQQILSAEQQIQMLTEKNEQLQDALNLVTEQNQKQADYQKILAEKLQQSFEENLQLLNSKADLQYQIVTLTRRLDVASINQALTKIRQDEQQKEEEQQEQQE